MLDRERTTKVALEMPTDDPPEGIDPDVWETALAIAEIAVGRRRTGIRQEGIQ